MQPAFGLDPREHNRCEFQHIGLPPRAPTAIRRPSGQARASVSRIREKTNKEEQIAGRRSASRTLPSPAPPPNPIQVGSSIFSGVARERPRGAGGGPRSEGRSREPCRADPGGPHSRRRRRRRRVGWKGREPPPLPPPPPGWAPFAVDAGGPGRGFIALNGFEPMKLDSLKKDGQPIV
ncbi:hypothetical protein CapIbe_021165 [Capra ibex]